MHVILLILISRGIKSNIYRMAQIFHSQNLSSVGQKCVNRSYFLRFNLKSILLDLPSFLCCRWLDIYARPCQAYFIFISRNVTSEAFPCTPGVSCPFPLCSSRVAPWLCPSSCCTELSAFLSVYHVLFTSCTFFPNTLNRTSRTLCKC